MQFINRQSQCLNNPNLVVIVGPISTVFRYAIKICAVTEICNTTASLSYTGCSANNSHNSVRDAV